MNFSKKDFSILIGNALDHFDTALYGFLAPLMGPIFFPHHDPVVQLILAYSIMATSIITRPLGALLFGIMARSRGPLVGLSYSLIGVAIGTMCIGCLPGYDLIGWLAPLLLIMVRMVRGVCAAGESTIAKLYIMEGKTNHHALKASYYYETSSMVGTIFASCMVAAGLYFPGMGNWWRICFLTGGITGIAGYYLRMVACAKDDIHIKQFQYAPLRMSEVWHHKANMLRVAVVTGSSYITYAIPFIFMNSFVPLVSSISFETMMALNTGLLVFDLLLIPIVGRYVVHYNPQRVLVVSALILACTIVPLFYGLTNATVGYVLFVRIWIVFWGVVFMCPTNIWKKGLFPNGDSYLLVGLGAAFGASTIGRMMTAVCLLLWYATASCLAPAIYIAGIMGAAAYAVVSSDSKIGIYVLEQGIELYRSLEDQQ